MPNVPPPIDQILYDHLVSLIHPFESTIQEIAVLPAASHPVIQNDPTTIPPAIGIPKPILLAAFLHARRIFNTHRDAINTISASQDHLTQLQNVYKATSILLLWEPNHSTAANWRKRYLLQSLQFSPSSPSDEELVGGEHINDAAQDEHGTLPIFETALKAELAFLSTLQSSPLASHAKSVNLWSHRLWLFRTFPTLRTDQGVSAVEIWNVELENVMAAGERHARNYHAWNAARNLWRYLIRDHEAMAEPDAGVEKVLQTALGGVHQWCLRHPRDISGWCFLVFLLNEVSVGWDSSIVEAHRILRGTHEWAEKLEWEGECMAWVFEATDDLHLGKKLIKNS